jgi:hypothetical protein
MASDHSATRWSERRLLTNARMEWIAAIRYAAKTARSKDLIGDKPESHFSLNPRLLTTDGMDPRETLFFS